VAIVDEETRILLEGLAEDDYWEYRGKNRNVSEGEAALEAVHIYEAYMLPAPAFAIEEISACWRLYKEGRKNRAFFVDKETTLPFESLDICVSLGEAFGMEKKPEKGDKRRAVKLNCGEKRSYKKVLPKLRKREIYRAIRVLHDSGKYSLSSEGENSAFTILADKLNLSVQAVIADYYGFEKEIQRNSSSN